MGYLLELVRAEEMLTDDPHKIWAVFAVAFDRFTEWDIGDMLNSGNSPEFVYSKPISNFLNPCGKSSNIDQTTQVGGPNFLCEESAT